MALRGVLWHQGEGGPYENHSERMVAQIEQWRELFEQDFWFIWGSLGRNASVPPPTVPLATSLRSNMNEEFLLASQAFGSDGKGLLVNFTDLGNAGTHWGMKQEAGLRMAGAALAHAYGKPETVYTGPEMTSFEKKGSEFIVHFKNTGGGLVYEPSIDGISGFLITGDGKIEWADVKIKGDSVTLSSPDINDPSAVYYGWHLNPHETLFNKEGYPAYNFRTDPRTYGPRNLLKETLPLVELVDGPKKALLNVVHVRRHGYIFSPIIFRGSGTATVRAYLPNEWKDALIKIGDQPVKEKMQTAADGARFYEFSTELNGPDIQVLDADNPPEFSNVNRF
jgi:sialate O-acetylesterase